MTYIIRLIPFISISWRLTFSETGFVYKTGLRFGLYRRKEQHTDLRLNFFQVETIQKNTATKAKEKYKNLLLSKSELSIWLDEYDDIFSDFDPSPYSDRTLSDDFLHEINKRVHENDTGKIQLKLLLPESRRNKERETVIVRHLHSHFKYEALHCIKHKKKLKTKGWLSTVIGLIIMMFAAWFVYNSGKHFSISILRVITEPAGRFFGLDWFRPGVL